MTQVSRWYAPCRLRRGRCIRGRLRYGSRSPITGVMINLEFTAFVAFAHPAKRSTTRLWLNSKHREYATNSIRNPT